MGAVKSKFRRSRSKSGSRKSENGEAKRSSKKQKSLKKVNLPESQSARKTVDPRLPFNNYRQIFSIRNAWKAIQRALDDCAMETMLKFLNLHPEYKGRFDSIKGLDTEEELRASTAFEDVCMDMYGLLDIVVGHLEEVDKALMEIHLSSTDSKFTQKMIKDYKAPFIDVIKQHLGSDRFTEATEENYKLLYQFVQEEMCKYIEEEGEDELLAVADTQVEVNLCPEAEVEVKDLSPEPETPEVNLCPDKEEEVNATPEKNADDVVKDSSKVNLCNDAVEHNG